MKEVLKTVVGHSNGAAHLLLVSRDLAWMTSLSARAEASAWQVETASSGMEALERIQSGPGPSLVVLDLAAGDTDGLYTLRWLHRVRPDLPVLMLGSGMDPQQRSESIRLGAAEYLAKPVEERQLEAVIHRYLHVDEEEGNGEVAGEQLIQVRDDRFFMAGSALMHKLRAQAELLAQVDVPLLIVGETGSGKETTARLIHKLSVRSGFTFLKVNCSALPAELLEKELFGYEPGTFSMGARGRQGKFELAQKGTIFLDDIADLPARLQSRLLQVLRERRHPHQGNGISYADVRIIAATSANLDHALGEKRLREDLYYQLSAFTVQVPSLRQRKDEIPLLIGHFMSQLAKHYGLPTRALSANLLEICQSHSWPGNLRELESFVKRYLVTGDEELALAEITDGNGWLDPTAWPVGAEELVGTREVEDHTSGLRSLVQSVKGEAERNAIAVALEQTHWNRKAAARLLKVSYRTLLYKIQQYHMSPPPGYLSPSMTSPGLKGNGHGS